jgi:hypothetical protein
VEETQRMGLQYLGEVHDAAEEDGRTWDSDGQQFIARFARGHHMAYRAYTAYAGRDRGHLVHGAAFAEFLKSTELCYVETGVPDILFFIEPNRDPGMALDPGYWVYCDLFGHSLLWKTVKIWLIIRIWF